MKLIYVMWKLKKWLCTLGVHDKKSPVVHIGKITVVSKKNKEAELLLGRWNIRKCRVCCENFSLSSDKL